MPGFSLKLSLHFLKIEDTDSPIFEADYHPIILASHRKDEVYSWSSDFDNFFWVLASRVPKGKSSEVFIGRHEIAGLVISPEEIRYLLIRRVEDLRDDCLAIDSLEADQTDSCMSKRD
jgi:hypothetical protein